MSFGIFDSLFDKLFSPPKGIDIPLSKKFTGSQNFMSHSYSYQNIPPEYKRAFDGNDCVNSAHQVMSGFSLDSKIDFLHILESSANKLVSRASKLFYPPNSSGLNIKDYSDIFPDPAMYINQTINLFCGELEKQHCELYPKSKMETVKNPPQVDSDTVSSPKKMRKTEDTGSVPPLVKHSNVPGHKQINNQVLNQELKSRKAKELQKRSKKRRRRQKKNTKRTAAPKAECKVIYDPSRISPPTNGNRDIYCDIMTLAEEANSVQILIPSFSSFVISVDSDDSEWESGSDCDWLADCAEFQFSGLFVANLAAKQTCPSENGSASHLDTSFDSDEELEIRQLKICLQRVNKCWAEATKGLEEKPKMPLKVSFAPDDQLVQTVLVEYCERKGEWETYATERLRFKRRIDEIESILSPCLSKEHRQKVFQRLHQDL